MLTGTEVLTDAHEAYAEAVDSIPAIATGNLAQALDLYHWSERLRGEIETLARRVNG